MRKLAYVALFAGLLSTSALAQTPKIPEIGASVPTIETSKTPPKIDVDAEKIRNQILASSVKIETENGHVGSGTVISSDKSPNNRYVTIILTNEHVIHGSNLVHVSFPILENNSLHIGFKTMEGVVIKKNSKFDLALIGLIDSTNSYSAVKLSETPVEFGEQVWTVGYPLGIATLVTAGYAGETHFDGVKEIMITTSAAIFGNSGGALFRKNLNGDFEMVGVPQAIGSAKKEPVTTIVFSLTNRTIDAFENTPEPTQDTIERTGISSE